jgi:two-component system, sensor histidine kinase
MAVLASFMEAIEPVGPCTLGEHVFQRFEREPNTLALAVVDSEGRPVGLVERNGFFLKMASHYGRALYARRRVETFMDSAPLVAEAETTAESFFRKVMAAEVQSLLHGFIVTRNGLYAGVGTALAVLQAGFALHRQRAEEMTRLAENLAWAETEAKAALRAKNQFLAVMSHEIRTPLNGVLGVAELIRTRLSQEELRPYVETISRSGESLLRLLTDAIDMSRAETGALELKQEPVRAGELAEAIEALWRPRAEQAGLDFRVIMDAGRETWVLADAVRLKQILNNLVGNALKFTASGHVTVLLNVTCDDELHARLRAEVEDSGPGVSDEHKTRIFEPFQTGAAHSGSGAGAGLGLAICRDLARQMDGDIGVSDRDGGCSRCPLPQRRMR